MSLKDIVSNLPQFAGEKAKELERELSDLLTTASDPNWFQPGYETVAKRLRKVVAETGKKFVDRENEAELIAAGLISGVSLLLLGPPGTAKSALVRELASLCGMSFVDGDGQNGGYFEYLLTNHTMPEEIFGGPDLNDLAKGRFKRNIEGKLPRAELAFLDEVFRGGSHILNTLLTIINEKRYDSGEGIVHVPLLGVIGASNMPPQDSDLEAFYDRFPIRGWLHSVFESRTHRRTSEMPRTHDLLNFSTDRERVRLSEGWNPEGAIKARTRNRISCTNDFRFARVWLLRRLGKVTKDSARFGQFEKLFRTIRERVPLSDRTFGQLWLFAGALDLLRGKEPQDSYPAADGHLAVFRYVPRSLHDVVFLNDCVDRNTVGLQYTGNR